MARTIKTRSAILCPTCELPADGLEECERCGHQFADASTKGIQTDFSGKWDSAQRQGSYVLSVRWIAPAIDRSFALWGVFLSFLSFMKLLGSIIRTIESGRGIYAVDFLGAVLSGYVFLAIVFNKTKITASREQISKSYGPFWFPLSSKFSFKRNQVESLVVSRETTATEGTSPYYAVALWTNAGVKIEVNQHRSRSTALKERAFLAQVFQPSGKIETPKGSGIDQTKNPLAWKVRRFYIASTIITGVITAASDLYLLLTPRRLVLDLWVPLYLAVSIAIVWLVSFFHQRRYLWWGNWKPLKPNNFQETASGYLLISVFLGIPIFLPIILAAKVLFDGDHYLN